MERGTERHLPKTDESVTKTYRDELKMNISAKSQWPSSAVEYRYGKGDIGLITAPVKTAMCSKVNFTVE